MRDFVYVKEGQEDLFVERALLLGYTELVLVYKKKPKQLYSSKKILIKTLFENSSSSDGYLVLGTSISQIPKKATHLLGNEFDAEKDFVHQRRSGLNHVQTKFCAQQGIILLFSFERLQGTSKPYQAIVLGRMKQNALLCKKYGVVFELVSLASSPENMRKASDVRAFSQLYFS